MFHQTACIKKKVLITGASGFIGSFLVEQALREGYEVYAGIRDTSSRNNLPYDNLRFFTLDLSSPQELEQRFRLFNRREGGFDYIIHNAGITRARENSDYQRVNYACTQRLVEAVLAAGRLPERFLFISSLAAIGPGSPEGPPIRLSDTPHPLSAYAKSKRSAELYLQSLPGFPYIIVRPTAVYGPRDKDFLAFFRLLQKGVEPYIGYQRQLLSLVYVKDLSRVVCRLLSAGRPRAAYLVSDGGAYPKEAIGRAVREALGRKTLRLRLPLAPVKAAVFCLEKLYALGGRQPFLHWEKLAEMTALNWQCDSSDCWQELDLQPAYTLPAGLAETARWYREQGWL